MPMHLAMRLQADGYIEMFWLVQSAGSLISLSTINLRASVEVLRCCQIQPHAVFPYLTALPPFKFAPHSTSPNSATLATSLISPFPIYVQYWRLPPSIEQSEDYFPLIFPSLQPSAVSDR